MGCSAATFPRSAASWARCSTTSSTSTPWTSTSSWSFATYAASACRNSTTSIRCARSSCRNSTAWKAKLREELSRLTRRVLRGETDYASSWIAAKKRDALRIFRQYVPEEGRHEAFWKRLDDNYFQRFEATEIGWHTRTLWSRT